MSEQVRTELLTSEYLNPLESQNDAYWADVPRVSNETETFTPEALFPGLEIHISALFEIGL